MGLAQMLKDELTTAIVKTLCDIDVRSNLHYNFLLAINVKICSLDSLAHLGRYVHPHPVCDQGSSCRQSYQWCLYSSGHTLHC